MSVRQITCFIAQCDDCGTDYEHDYTPHWPSGGEAIDDAVNSGEWWSDDTRLLCSDCAMKPHAFVPTKVWADRCDRCPHPEEEHEAPAVPS